MIFSLLAMVFYQFTVTGDRGKGFEDRQRRPKGRSESGVDEQRGQFSYRIAVMRTLVLFYDEKEQLLDNPAR